MFMKLVTIVGVQPDETERITNFNGSLTSSLGLNRQESGFPVNNSFILPLIHTKISHALEDLEESRVIV